MELLNAFLFLYTLINIFILIIYGLTGSDLWQFESFKSALIYPALWRSLDDADLNTAGKIIICTLCLLMSIPSYIIWILILLMLVFIEFLVNGFCILFRKR